MKPRIHYKWTVLSVTTVGMFMASLDASIVVVGLPTILENLKATIVHGIWIITGYRLMLVVLGVLLGRLADIHGRVKYYNIGFIIFTAGSLFCGLSQNGPELIIFRLVQGAGGALLIANSAAIITDAFPMNQLGLALGVNMMAFNIGAVAGYTLSGVMITYFGWRSIFYLNVPVGIFGTIWAYMRLKEVSIRDLNQKFDYLGAALYTASLLLVLLGLAIGDPTSLNNIVVIGAGLGGFVALIFVENRQKFPTLDLSLFKIRMFAAGNLSSFLNSIAYNCGPFLMSIYLQLVMGYVAYTTGVILIPMELVVFTVSPISGRLADKFGSRMLSSIGLALNAGALFWFSTLTPQSPYGSVLVSLMLFGFGRALFVSPNSSSIMSSVPVQKRGIANGVRMTLVNTGNVLSVPSSLLLMTFVMPYSRLSQIVGSSQFVNSGELAIFSQAINYTCSILGIVTLLAIIPSSLRGPRQAKEQPVITVG